MKMIIELNYYVSLEQDSEIKGDEVRICFSRGTESEKWADVKIEDLRLALRKLTAK